MNQTFQIKSTTGFLKVAEEVSKNNTFLYGVFKTCLFKGFLLATSLFNMNFYYKGLFDGNGLSLFGRSVLVLNSLMVLSVLSSRSGTLLTEQQPQATPKQQLQAEILIKRIPLTLVGAIASALLIYKLPFISSVFKSVLRLQEPQLLFSLVCMYGLYATETFTYNEESTLETVAPSPNIIPQEGRSL